MIKFNIFNALFIEKNYLYYNINKLYFEFFSDSVNLNNILKFEF